MLVPVAGQGAGMGISSSSPQYGARNVGELEDVSFNDLNKHAITLGNNRDDSIFCLSRIKDEYMRFGFVNVSKEIDKKFNELKEYVDNKFLSLTESLGLNQSNSQESSSPEEEGKTYVLSKLTENMSLT